MKITIDINKVDRTKIQERKYQNRDGAEITERNLELNVIDLKEFKTRDSKDGRWRIVKTHLLAQPQSPVEKEKDIKTPIVGEVYHFEEINGKPIVNPNDGAEYGF